jgi:hypothetical protein
MCKKFKRCGSAKVIWHFYKQHLPQSTANNGGVAVGDWLQLTNAERDTGRWLHSYDKDINGIFTDSAGECTTKKRPGDLLLFRHSTASADCAALCDYVTNTQVVDNSNSLGGKADVCFTGEPADGPMIGDKTFDSLSEAGDHCCDTDVLLEKEASFVSQQTGSCNNQLIKLAKDLVAAQGKTSSLAEKMLDSASLIQLMTEKLDEMDESLHGLETHLSGLEHDTEADSESGQQMSLEVMSGLTSTAFELLSNAHDVLWDDSNNLKEVCHLTDLEKVEVREAFQSVNSPVNTLADNKTCNITDVKEELFKSIEKQIYVTSSELFMLEEHVQELQCKVLSTD